MRVVLAGTTGLVGRALAPMLLRDGHSLLSLGRRASGLSHPGCEEWIVDFAALPALPPVDAAISTLGTTIRAAGSRAAFEAVDHGAVMALARAALAAGARRFFVVTAVGAQLNAPAFYSRVKGEVERDLRQLGFERLDIMRPGLLLGERTERRPAEAMAQRIAPLMAPLLRGPFARYGAIEGAAVAHAITALLGRPATPGIFVHGNSEILSLRPEKGLASQ